MAAMGLTAYQASLAYPAHLVCPASPACREQLGRRESLLLAMLERLERKETLA